MSLKVFVSQAEHVEELCHCCLYSVCAGFSCVDVWRGQSAPGVPDCCSQEQDKGKT